MQVEWSPEESVGELLVLLRERDLSAISLLAAATEEVAEASYMRAIKGQIVELAALLLVAADMIIVPVSVTREGKLTVKKSRMLYQAVLHEAMGLFEMEKRAQIDVHRVKYGLDSIMRFRRRRKLLLSLSEIELIHQFRSVVLVVRNNCKKKKVLRPLLHAVQIGDESVAELLIEVGADPSEADAVGNSALHSCLMGGSISQNLRLIWLLLKHGAKVSQRNVLGLTPIHFAAANGNYQALQILVLQAPECVDLASVKQETPLFFSVRNGIVDCTELLLQYGADPKAFNLRRERPVDLATSHDMRYILNPMNQALLKCSSPPQEDDSHHISWSSVKVLNDEIDKQILGACKLGNVDGSPKASSHGPNTGICRYCGSPSGCSRSVKCNYAYVEGRLRRVKPTLKDRKIFVGGLPLTVDSEYMREFFEAEFGPVDYAEVIKSQAGGHLNSGGFGFVIFKQVVPAAAVIEARVINIFGKRAEIKSVTLKSLSESENPSLPCVRPNLSYQKDLEGEIASLSGSGQSNQKEPASEPVMISLTEQSQLPPWALKFRKWLPHFLRDTFKQFGDGEGYPLSSLKADFRATCQMDLDHASLGFLKLSDLIRALPGVCKMQLVPLSDGLASHMVLLPLSTRSHHEQLHSMGYVKSSQSFASLSNDVKLTEFTPVSQVSEGASLNTESTPWENVPTDSPGPEKGQTRLYSLWSNTFDFVLQNQKNNLEDEDHNIMGRKDEGGSAGRPPSRKEKGAETVVEPPSFSLFDRQWDYYLLANGRCTICYSNPGSLAIIPCHHKVCNRCYKDPGRTTCIICNVKMEGATMPNPTLSYSEYPPLGVGLKQHKRHPSTKQSATSSSDNARCRLKYACQGARATVFCLPCGHKIACRSCLPAASETVVIKSCTTCQATVDHLDYQDA